MFARFAHLRNSITYTLSYEMLNSIFVSRNMISRCENEKFCSLWLSNLLGNSQQGSLLRRLQDTFILLGVIFANRLRLIYFYVSIFLFGEVFDSYFYWANHKMFDCFKLLC